MPGRTGPVEGLVAGGPGGDGESGVAGRGRGPWLVAVTTRLQGSARRAGGCLRVVAVLRSPGPGPCCLASGTGAVRAVRRAGATPEADPCKGFRGQGRAVGGAGGQGRRACPGGRPGVRLKTTPWTPVRAHSRTHSQTRASAPSLPESKPQPRRLGSEVFHCQEQEPYTKALSNDLGVEGWAGSGSKIDVW